MQFSRFENGERVRGGSRSIHQKLERCLQREDTSLDGYGIGDFQFVGRIEGEGELDDFSGKRRGLGCGGNCGGREQGFEPEALACRVVWKAMTRGAGRVEINKSAFDQFGREDRSWLFPSPSDAAGVDYGTLNDGS
jgi:hypothetical protein